MRVALDLINELALDPPTNAGAAVAAMLAFDAESAKDFRASQAVDFQRLADDLHTVVIALDEDRVADAAGRLNAMLAAVPASPYLANEDGVWRLHHHPRGADLVEAWTSTCAESIARLVGEGHASRMHRCAAPDCRRAFVDTTKNATRRYCSERCQNRMKASALRRRRAGH